MEMISQIEKDKASVIDVRQVSKAYREGGGTRQILSSIDLAARAGEFIAVGGASGSGKSTLLHLLAGLDHVDSGTIHIAGRNMTALDNNAGTLHRRRHIGMVFQFFNLVPTLTVEENLRLPLMLNGLTDEQERVRGLLEEFGLIQRADTYPDALSGGEQQRVAVLRAAVHEPTVILADEPTGNLDRTRGEAVINLLDSLTLRGACVVMVTHSRRAAEAAGRRLHLVDGELKPWEW